MARWFAARPQLAGGDPAPDPPRGRAPRGDAVHRADGRVRPGRAPDEDCGGVQQVSELRDEVEAAGFACMPRALAEGALAELIERIAPEAGAHAIRNLLWDRAALGPALAQLGIDAIATEALGAPAFPINATYFDKTADANWKVPGHQDLMMPVAGEATDPGFSGWREGRRPPRRAAGGGAGPAGGAAGSLRRLPGDERRAGPAGGQPSAREAPRRRPGRGDERALHDVRGGSRRRAGDEAAHRASVVAGGDARAPPGLARGLRERRAGPPRPVAARGSGDVRNLTTRRRGRPAPVAPRKTSPLGPLGDDSWSQVELRETNAGLKTSPQRGEVAESSRRVRGRRSFSISVCAAAPFPGVERGPGAA